ncbi:5' nucleotidase, NT5C type [Desulfogranum japonicum]|uniref:5' nucleotidase, NT5C type n=1 Tax=Desulfogranum japonicum TaxID=231447 RepID=UPI0003FD6A97|nr:hypothetical protein [Desulfogranum japonicum]
MVPQRFHPSDIGFDFDGVIADIGEAFIRLACEEYDHCGIALEQITSFHVEQCLDMPEEIVETIFLKILKDSLATGLIPMPGAVPVLEEMSQTAPVTIITARPIGDPVARWMQNYFSEETHQQIRLVAMGDHDDKVRHIKELSLTCFIDDRVETCLQLREAGITSYLFAQPWNRSCTSLPRMKSWEDIRSLYSKTL